MDQVKILTALSSVTRYQKYLASQEIWSKLVYDLDKIITHSEQIAGVCTGTTSGRRVSGPIYYDAVKCFCHLIVTRNLLDRKEVKCIYHCMDTLMKRHYSEHRYISWVLPSLLCFLNHVCLDYVELTRKLVSRILPYIIECIKVKNDECRVHALVLLSYCNNVIPLNHTTKLTIFDMVLENIDSYYDANDWKDLIEVSKPVRSLGRITFGSAAAFALKQLVSMMSGMKCHDEMNGAFTEKENIDLEESASQRSKLQKFTKSHDIVESLDNAKSTMGKVAILQLLCFLFLYNNVELLNLDSISRWLFENMNSDGVAKWCCSTLGLVLRHDFKTKKTIQKKLLIHFKETWDNSGNILSEHQQFLLLHVCRTAEMAEKTVIRKWIAQRVLLFFSNTDNISIYLIKILDELNFKAEASSEIVDKVGDVLEQYWNAQKISLAVFLSYKDILHDVDFFDSFSKKEANWYHEHELEPRMAFSKFVYRLEFDGHRSETSPINLDSRSMSSLYLTFSQTNFDNYDLKMLLQLFICFLKSESPSKLDTGNFFVAAHAALEKHVATKELGSLSLLLIRFARELKFSLSSHCLRESVQIPEFNSFVLNLLLAFVRVIKIRFDDGTLIEDHVDIFNVTQTDRVPWLRTGQHLMVFFGTVARHQKQFGLMDDESIVKTKNILVDMLFTTYIPSSLLSTLFNDVFANLFAEELFNELLEHLLETHRFLGNDSGLIGYMAQVASKKDIFNMKQSGLDGCLSKIPLENKLSAENWSHLSTYLQIFEFIKSENGFFSYVCNLILQDHSVPVMSKLLDTYGASSSFDHSLSVVILFFKMGDYSFLRNIIGYSLFVKDSNYRKFILSTFSNNLECGSLMEFTVHLLPNLIETWCAHRSFDDFPLEALKLNKMHLFENAQAISALIKSLLLKQKDSVNVQSVYEYLKDMNSASSSKFGYLILGHVACMYNHILENVFRPDQASILLREKFAETFVFVLEDSLDVTWTEYAKSRKWDDNVKEIVINRLQRLNSYCGNSIDFTSLVDNSARSVLAFLLRRFRNLQFPDQNLKCFLSLKIMIDFIDFSKISHITARMIWNSQWLADFSDIATTARSQVKCQFIFSCINSGNARLREFALIFLLEMTGSFDSVSLVNMFEGKFSGIKEESPYYIISEVIFNSKKLEEFLNVKDIIRRIIAIVKFLGDPVQEDPRVVNILLAHLADTWSCLEHCIAHVEPKTFKILSSNILLEARKYSYLKSYSCCKANLVKLTSMVVIYSDSKCVAGIDRVSPFSEYEIFIGGDISAEESVKSFLISKGAGFLGELDNNICTVAYDVILQVFREGGTQSFSKLLDGSLQQYLLPIFEESSVMKDCKGSLHLSRSHGTLDPRKSVHEFSIALGTKMIALNSNYKDFYPFLKLIWASSKFSELCLCYISGFRFPAELLVSLQDALNGFDIQDWNVNVSNLCNASLSCVRYFSQDTLTKSGRAFAKTLDFQKLSDMCSLASDFHSAMMYLEMCMGVRGLDYQSLKTHFVSLIEKHKEHESPIAYRSSGINSPVTKASLALAYGLYARDITKTSGHINSLVQSLLRHSMPKLLPHVDLHEVSPEIIAEISWRNSQWDLDSSGCTTLPTLGMNQLLLLCGRNSSNILPSWQAISGTSMTYGNRGLVGSLSLLELEHCSNLTGREQLILLRNKMMINNTEFCMYEPVVSYRIAFLQKQVANNANDAAVRILHQSVFGLSFCARKCDNVQLALNSCGYLKSLTEKYYSQATVIADYEYAKCLWIVGETSTGIGKLRSLIELFEKAKPQDNGWYFAKGTNLIGDRPNDVYRYFMAKMYCKLGVWTGVLRSETHEIVENYFQKSLCYLDDQDNVQKLKGRTYWRLAQFSDQQYVYIKKSSSYRAICELNEKQQKTMSQVELNMQNLNSRAEKSAMQQMKKKLYAQYVIDGAEFDRFNEKLNHHSNLAVSFYLKALSTIDKHDDCVYRLVSLWFENISVDSLNRSVTDLLPLVPSWKFLGLMHQLSAKYCICSCDETTFSANLLKLLKNICVEHPHHSLPQIFALKNSQYKSGVSASNIMKDDRFKISIEIIRLVTQRSDYHHKLVMEMEKFCDAYNEFAYFDAKAHKEKHPKMNSLPLDGLKIKQLLNMNHMHIPTVDLDIQRSGDYSEHIVLLKSIGREYLLVGGINLPKRIKILGSNNRVYLQLVKGNDDLRQDAVLQQVFCLVNDMLESNPETSRTSITMPTYKVVPLSARSGIVEWVENCVPIGTWLTSAHKLYHPDDYEASKCREKMRKESEKQSWTPQSKLSVYDDICLHFRPVMRCFFYEHFISGDEWFAAKAIYSKTCAVASILGYILGIGDRHAHNILIDNKTARLVHIDLGIAFEQGKLLSIPESVPFRLTPDIVDGMGLTGTDGMFRKSCELVLQLLQMKREILMTVLSVFKHDPLYNWTVTSHILARKSDDQGAQKQALQSEQADRALYSVETKLSSSLSAACQINDLIREATDKKSLAMMFHGWQPWM